MSDGDGDGYTHEIPIYPKSENVFIEDSSDLQYNYDYLHQNFQIGDVFPCTSESSSSCRTYRVVNLTESDLQLMQLLEEWDMAHLKVKLDGT